MMSEKFVLLVLVLGITVFHFVFKWTDEKRIRDERESLIHLKSLELMHNVTSWVFSLLTLAWVFVFYAQLSSLYFIVTMFASWQLSYPLAKIYYRQKI